MNPCGRLENGVAMDATPPLAMTELIPTQRHYSTFSETVAVRAQRGQINEAHSERNNFLLDTTRPVVRFSALQLNGFQVGPPRVAEKVNRALHSAQPTKKPNFSIDAILASDSVLQLIDSKPRDNTRPAAGGAQAADVQRKCE